MISTHAAEFWTVDSVHTLVAVFHGSASIRGYFEECSGRLPDFSLSTDDRAKRMRVATFDELNRVLKSHVLSGSE